MTTNDKILVTGATGHYGYAVIESLIENGVHESLIYAMVRDYTKVEKLKSLNVNIVFGDYNHYSSELESDGSQMKKLLGSKAPNGETISGENFYLEFFELCWVKN